MTHKADSYLKRAEQMEALARSAQADSAKTIYEHLAWSYRQLGVHAHQIGENGAERDGLTERIVAGDTQR
jgi:hypothetical protein